jgi:nucleoside-diphosphate-sugar epimerase
MRVLVLGGTGFIGGHIVQRLLKYGHDVAILRRESSAAELPGSVFAIRGDTNKLDASSKAFHDFAPDAVVDAIAFTEDQAKALIAAFAGVARRLIVLSGGDVYRANDLLFRRIEGPLDPTPLTELSPLRERLYPYRGTSLSVPADFNLNDYEKILVESVVTSHPDLPATILRLPMVYGSGDHTGLKRRFWP